MCAETLAERPVVAVARVSALADVPFTVVEHVTMLAQRLVEEIVLHIVQGLVVWFAERMPVVDNALLLAQQIAN
jgi:hypothetical protein